MTYPDLNLGFGFDQALLLLVERSCALSEGIPINKRWFGKMKVQQLIAFALNLSLRAIDSLKFRLVALPFVHS